MRKKLLAALLSASIIITPLTFISQNTAYASETTLNESILNESISLSIEKSGAYLSGKESLEGWQIPSMVRIEKLSESQKQNALSEINQRIAKDYADEYSSQLVKDILTLTSLGQNPESYNGYDLVNKMLSMNDYAGSCNYEVWVLFTSTLNPYAITDNNKQKINSIVVDILSRQNKDGGFSYSSFYPESDVDMTGMAVFVLSNYSEKTDQINAAISSGKNYILDELAKKNGKFDNSNTTAMAILGLSSVGYDCSSLVQDLLSFQLSDGSFTWQLEGDYAGPNDLSTEQALYSLIQYSAAKQNKNIFNFNNAWTYKDLLSTQDQSENSTTVSTSTASDKNPDSESSGQVTTDTAECSTVTATNSATDTESSTNNTGDKNGLLIIMMFLLASSLGIKNYKKKGLK